jgi:UDP-N-acetylmuramoyl-tripeptide--D-alanyl-D-alanine ligase
MKRFLSYYNPKLPILVTYMLQQVEYDPAKFIKWLFRYPDLTRVMHRQTVVWTYKARALAFMVYFFFIFYILISLMNFTVSPLAGLFSLFLTPYLVILLTYLTVLCVWLYYEEPRRKQLIKKAKRIFKDHKGVKIAITGSYGKTTIKELLLTVLGEGKSVAATPGNKNVPVSHSAWAKKLTGKEDVLLIEYGEAAPGDIKKMADLTQPDYGIITGLAPNHLDAYKHLDSVAEDLLSLAGDVEKKNIFINGAVFSGYNIDGFDDFSGKEVLGWKIDKVKVTFDGTTFEMTKKKQKIHVASGLLGRHLVAPLALTAALAREFGLSVGQIEKGLSKTMPYDHRMQPRQQHGAWIIDDTYNGSLEGIRAGLELLGELPGKRKIYVTPGLVDQGEETERVHLEIGKLIAKANPDRTVLMQNSVTQHIAKGLEENSYRGELHIESDPLTFYTNLEHVIVGGDLVMMQNDWTDNYT